MRQGRSSCRWRGACGNWHEGIPSLHLANEAMSGNRRTWKEKVLDPRATSVLLLGVVVVVYANSLNNGFHFDDEHSLTANPAVRRIGNIPAFFTDPGLFSRDPGSGMYRPLVLISYALTYAVAGYSGPAFHAVNVIVHALVVLLATALLRQVYGDARAALLGGLLIAVHPLASEPVNYVSSRSESMAAAGYVAAVLLHRRSGGRAGWPSLLAFGAALLSKSTAVTLPLVLLLHDRMTGWGSGSANRQAGSPQDQVCRPAAVPSVHLHPGTGDASAAAFTGAAAVIPATDFCRDLVRRYGAYWLLAGIYVLGTRTLLLRATTTAPVRPLIEHWLIQTKALAYYIRLLMFPQPLSVEHQFGTAAGWTNPALLAALALSGTLVWLIRRQRISVFWCAWMLLALLPTLMVPLNVLVNERRLYLPLVAGTGWLIGLLRDHVWRFRSTMGTWMLLSLLTVLTVQRNTDWRSTERLWAQARRVSPQAVRPHLRLGSVYRQAGWIDQARTAYLRVLDLDSTNASAYNNLGNLYEAEGHAGDAKLYYAKALRLQPHYVEAQVNLAALYSRSGHLNEAIALLEAARQAGNERPAWLNNLGTTYLRAERYDEAIEVLQQAVALEPDHAGMRYNLAGALAGAGRLQAAETAFRAALQLDPAHAGAHVRLGELLQQQGRPQEAARAYRSFLEHWHGDPATADVVHQRLRRLEKAP